MHSYTKLLFILWGFLSFLIRCTIIRLLFTVKSWLPVPFVDQVTASMATTVNSKGIIHTRGYQKVSALML